MLQSRSTQTTVLFQVLPFKPTNQLIAVFTTDHKNSLICSLQSLCSPHHECFCTWPLSHLCVALTLVSVHLHLAIVTPAVCCTDSQCTWPLSHLLCAALTLCTWPLSHLLCTALTLSAPGSHLVCTAMTLSAPGPHLLCVALTRSVPVTQTATILTPD